MAGRGPSVATFDRSRALPPSSEPPTRDTASPPSSGIDIASRRLALERAIREAESGVPEAPGRREDLALAAHAAWAGGVAACRHYGGDLDIRDKGDDDPVTAADHAANAAILEILHGRRPDDAVLSEESRPPADRGRGGRLWIVDPLDGTKEFIARNGEFSVMVGLAEDGRAVLGAVYQPATDRLFAGFSRGGAWVVAGAPHGPEVDRLALPAGSDPPRPIRFARSRSHPDERLCRLSDALGDIEEVISGSVGIKCALVAQGLADLYVHPVPFLKEWDTCAPEAVLRGAGGTVTDCASEPLAYGKVDPVQPHGIFAATEAARRAARPILREVVRGWIDAGAGGGDEPRATRDPRAADHDSTQRSEA